jgi:hypothetical protein
MTRPTSDDQWAVVECCFDGDDLPTIFRFRTRMPAKQVRTAHPVLIILRWPYTAKKNGMPRKADLDRMNAFEDAMEVAVEAPKIGIPVACLTGNGRRTWRYFVADAKPFLKIVNPLMKTHGPEPQLFRNRRDAEWESLTELLQMLD